MKAKPVNFRARLGPNAGELIPGELIICPDPECQGEVFYIFQIAGHQHIQCAGCDTTYCGSGGDCELEPPEEERGQ